MWTNYIEPAFGQWSTSPLTTADVSDRTARIMRDGKSAATARRTLATLRSILEHAVADGRVVGKGLLHGLTTDRSRPEGLGWKDVTVSKPYPKEFRDDVVRVARNRGPDVDLEQIAKDFGIHFTTLCSWLKRADVEDGNRVGSTMSDSVELRTAQRRIEPPQVSCRIFLS